MLVHMSVIIYVDNIQPFWIVSSFFFFLTDNKVSRVLVSSSYFLLFEKMDQRNCIKFCELKKI